MSKNAVINIKTDPATKRDLQALAKELGLSVSTLINADIRRLLRERKIELDASLTPTPYLEKIMREAEEDIKHNRNISGPFETVDALFDHLDHKS